MAELHTILVKEGDTRNKERDSREDPLDQSAQKSVSLADQMKRNLLKKSDVKLFGSDIQKFGPIQMKMPREKSKGGTPPLYPNNKSNKPPTRQAFDLGLLGGGPEERSHDLRVMHAPIRHAPIMPPPLEDSSATSMDSSTRESEMVIPNRHIWAQDPIGASQSYRQPKADLDVLFRDERDYYVENKDTREDETYYSESSYEEGTLVTMDEPTMIIDCEEEDWITRPMSTEAYGCLCCLPGEFY